MLPVVLAMLDTRLDTVRDREAGSRCLLMLPNRRPSWALSEYGPVLQLAPNRSSPRTEIFATEVFIAGP